MTSGPGLTGDDDTRDATGAGATDEKASEAGAPVAPADPAAAPGAAASPDTQWQQTSSWEPAGPGAQPGWNPSGEWSYGPQSRHAARDARRAERDAWRQQRRAEREAWRGPRRRVGGGLVLGLLLVLAGVYLLARQLAPSVPIDQYWPYAAIGLGLVLVAASFLAPEA